MKEILKPAVFLDRDGVINEHRPDYVKSWDEFRFLPGVLEALKNLAKSKFRIIVVSNQSIIGRGIVKSRIVEEINNRMKIRIEETGGRVDAVYYCPHKPEDYCECRKPKPGMLIQAATEFGIDMNRSYFIGDSISDVEAAYAAGCQPILVLTGLGKEHIRKMSDQGYYDKVPIAPNLTETVGKIIG